MFRVCRDDFFPLSKFLRYCVNVIAVHYTCTYSCANLILYLFLLNRIKCSLDDISLKWNLPQNHNSFDQSRASVSVTSVKIMSSLFFGQRPRREPEGTKSCRIKGESVCLYVNIGVFLLATYFIWFEHLIRYRCHLESNRLERGQWVAMISYVTAAHQYMG